MKKNEDEFRTLYQSFWMSKILKIMKLTTILLIFTVLQVTAKETYSQATKLNMDMGETTVEQVLNEIENQSEFYFLFNQKLVDVSRKVHLSAKDHNINKILASVFKGTDIDYYIMDRQIILSPSEYLAETKVKQQPRTVTGTIVDPEGEPMIGATISIKGTSVGTITNVEGTYTLSDVPDDATLVFSYIGMLTQEIEVGAQSMIDVVFSPDVLGLEEVVVIGYGTVKRSDLTGSVSSVDIAQANTGDVTSLGTALQGQASGVQVIQNSGTPGSEYTIRIRGGNSMIGGNDPLYVVDGFPVSGTDILNLINIEDVQSIDILKDASSTAIYGSRGANGVIMITTKKGKIDNSWEFNGSFGIQQAASSIPLMNSNQYAKMVNDWSLQEGLEIPYPDINNLPYNTDWQKEIFRNAPVQNYSLSFSGGNEKTRYYISGNYMDQQGIVISSDYRRGSVRAMIESNVTSKLKISNLFLFVNSARNQVPFDIVEHAFIAPPTIPVYDENGNYYDYSELPWWGAYPRNPVADAQEITDYENNFRIMDNFSAEYTFIDGLKFKTLWGIDLSNYNNDVYYTRLHEGGGEGGRAENDWSRNLDFLNENTLNFNKTYGNHYINATVGFTWQRGNNRGMSLVGRGFVNDLLTYHVIGSADEISPPETSRSDWTLISWLGRINYNFTERYLFTATLRADGSSRFGSGNKWGVFPSFALAWRPLKEAFLENVATNSFLDDMKLRLSWGITGNQEIGNYNSLQRISPISYNDADNLRTGYAPVSIANPDLGWEETEQYNIGLDLGFWERRLTLSIDGYIKNTSNLLALVNLPPSSGFESMLINIGEIRNSGLELGMDIMPVNRENLYWQIGANIAWNKNEVVKLAGNSEFLAPSMGVLGPIHLISVGQPLSVFYGYEGAGVDEEDGSYTYRDVNNDGSITDEDRVILGSPYPDFIYGINSNLKYRNFDFSLSLHGVYGNKIYSYANGLSAASLAKGYNQITDVSDNYWTSDNKYPGYEYPKLNTAGYDRPSDRFIEDGSYLRLSNLRIGYNFNLPSGNKINLSEFMIFLSVRNLFTITNYPGYDPQINNYGSSDLRTGVDYFTYPPARVYTIGLRLRM